MSLGVENRRGNRKKGVENDSKSKGNFGTDFQRILIDFGSILEPVLAREREARLKLEYFKTKFKNLSFSCELTERTTERTHNNNKERTQKKHRENKRKRTQREHKERTQKEHKERTQN